MWTRSVSHDERRPINLQHQSTLNIEQLRVVPSLKAQDDLAGAAKSYREERLDDIGQIADQTDLVEKAANLINAAPGSEQARSAHAVLMVELEPHVTYPRSSYIELFVMEPERGKVVASTSLAEEGTSKLGQPYFDNGKTDLCVQAPSHSDDLNVPAMTAALPLRATNGRVVAVLAARLNLTVMNTIALRLTGLYRTEDPFLVNAEQFLITQPRFIREPAVMRRKTDTEACRAQQRSRRGLNGQDESLEAEFRVPTAGGAPRVGGRVKSSRECLNSSDRFNRLSACFFLA